MSHWAPAGNEVDLEFADFARWFAEQPTTGAIAAYIEGFKDGRTVQLAADAAMQHGVPIVCVKVGRTEEGTSMAASHTGHLTGTDRVIDGVFRQYGITRVDGLDELSEVSTAFCRTVAPPKGRARERRVCVYAISGGTGAHMADLCAEAGLTLPPLTTSTQEELRTHIPGYLRVSNPVDNGGAPSGDERGRKILDAIVADPEIDAIVVPDHRRARLDVRPVHRRSRGRPGDDRQADLRGVGLADVRGLLQRAAGAVGRAGVPHVPELRAGRAGLVRLLGDERTVDVTVRQAGPASLSGRGRRSPRCSPKAARCRRRTRRRCSPRTASPSRATSCADPAAAVRALKELGGPVVVKIASADIGHKSDLGLVRLGVTTPAEMRRCWDDFDCHREEAGATRGGRRRPRVRDRAGRRRDDGGRQPRRAVRPRGRVRPRRHARGRSSTTWPCVCLRSIARRLVA